MASTTFATSSAAKVPEVLLIQVALLSMASYGTIIVASQSPAQAMSMATV
jgi:hypothetical protein